MFTTLFLALTLLQPFNPHSAVIYGHADEDTLIYLRSVGESDRQPAGAVTTFDCNDIKDNHVLVIQSDSYVDFKNCSVANVKSQSSYGFLANEGTSSLIGEVQFKGPVLLTFAFGKHLWVKPITSIKHAVTTDKNGNYALVTPVGGIHVIDAWHPKYGTWTKVVTVFRAAHINWLWEDRSR